MKSIAITIIVLAALTGHAAAVDTFGRQTWPTDPSLKTSKSATDRAASMFDEIVGWLSSHFDLPSTRSKPTIALASQAELMKLRAEDRAQWQGFKYDDDPTHVRNVVAVYDSSTTTIYLPLNWTGNSPEDQSVLVHELVHHLQKSGTLKYECPAAREKVAYLAQDAWLKRFNMSLEDKFDIDMFTIVASSACM